jgi:predicted nucleotidyltransferase
LLDPIRSDPALLHLVDVVVTELLAKSTHLSADEVMIVGARCRDILQSALGHKFSLRAEVFEAALPLSLPNAGTIRIPPSLATPH